MAISVDGLLERVGLLRIPKIGIAFGGGGARGFSHIGVLMAMEEYGLKPEILSGVSAGSIAAVLYGAGLTPQEMIECFAEASKFADFTDFVLPKEGLFKLNKFAKQLESWLPVKNLEDMKIPTIICATNINKGTSVGWCKGEIVPRVLASCSIPIIFKPVRINGEYYVDGGVLRNLPAWAIRDFCKTLIGSNCSPLQKNYKYRQSIIDVAMRTFQLMMKANVPQDLRLCDYVIMPRELSNMKTFDLTNLKNSIKAGYDAARIIIEQEIRKQ